MAHIILLPFGSAGDVFPFIWLGRHLRTRGHSVTMITACLFEEYARAAGLDFVPLGKPEDFDVITMKDYPPSQSPGSFNLEGIQKKMEASMGGR